jgi:hypothetical protein
LKAAKHCSCSGRCICQVQQILEQYSYLKTGVSTGFAGLKLTKFSQKPSTTPVTATNPPQLQLIWAYFAHFL